MKYLPGSFSKNFAWHGTGLRKLHTAIGEGFGNSLTSVPRQQWRDRSGIGDNALELIPVNFFLHNMKGNISVDELVSRAIEYPHLIEFDRLGLFTLHLNRVGKTSGAPVERPAMWANEFVREVLWQDGAWRSAALAEESLDSFIEDRMNATSGVRIKCRTNYRYLFQLCGYWPSSLPIINTGAEQWVASALFLAWDRLILDNNRQTKTELVNYVAAEEIYKLLGVPESYLNNQIESLVDLYLSAGGLARLDRLEPPTAPVEIAEEAGIEWIDQAESDGIVERRTLEVQSQVRNRKLAAALKRRYDNICAVCGVKLQVGEVRFYSEAAHIKPLGKPHNGPDKASNMLVLCPNHHLQFDRGILRLRKTENGYVLQSRTEDDPLDGKNVTLKHDLDDSYVQWHYEWSESKRT